MKTLEDFQAAFAAKIDSPSALHAVCAAAEESRREVDLPHGLSEQLLFRIGTETADDINTACSHRMARAEANSANAVFSVRRLTGANPAMSVVWPLYRDVLREALGVYPEPTEALLTVRTMIGDATSHIFPHMARKEGTDDGMIAYTASQADALADRKVRITFGRFLRKFLPLLTDAYIQQLEAEHRAELDPTIEIARTIEAVEAIYTGMPGDTGCMRYPRAHFNRNADVHPSYIYASPNLGVAVLRNASGQVTARTVVYESPTDPADKRYVRIFGDAMLAKKLERLGYKLGGLGGVYVNVRTPKNNDGLVNGNGEAVDEDDTRINVVWPYVDAPGTRADIGRRFADPAGTVYDTDVGMALILTMDQARSIKAAGREYGPARASGRLVIPKVSMRGIFNVTCPLTGQTGDSRDPDCGIVYMGVVGEDGAISVQGAFLRNVPDTHNCTGTARVNGHNVSVFVTSENFAAYALAHGAWPNPETLRYYGYQAAWPDLCGGRRWAMSGEVVSRLLEGPTISAEAALAEGWVSTAKVVTVDEEGKARAVTVPVSDIERNGATLLRLGGLDGSDVYALPSAAHLIQTSKSGRKVVPGVHHYGFFADGSLRSLSGAAQYGVPGRMTWVDRATRRAIQNASNPADMDAGAAMIVAALMKKDPVSGTTLSASQVRSCLGSGYYMFEGGNAACLVSTAYGRESKRPYSMSLEEAAHARAVFLAPTDPEHGEPPEETRRLRNDVLNLRSWRLRLFATLMHYHLLTAVVAENASAAEATPAAPEENAFIAAA